MIIKRIFRERQGGNETTGWIELIIYREREKKGDQITEWVEYRPRDYLHTARALSRGKGETGRSLQSNE